ncbi:MAG: hypothetical protein ORN98_07450 [Alphaproteobacteria bacterium]|nr:hypothetical protein [Alphaproteobacteria bacterium]
MLENGLYNNDRAKIDQGKIAELHDRSLATDPSYLAKLIKTYGTNDADKLINVGQHIDNNHSLYVNNPRLFTGMLSFVG